MKVILSTLLFILIAQVRAADFSAIELSGWKKEKLSIDHLRFTNSAQSNDAIHIQVDSYDPKDKWDQKNLTAEIKKMEKIRNGMSFFMGMKDYKIISSKYDGNKLELQGSYLRGNKTVVFKEINFYHREHFLQFKIISDSKLPAEEEIKKLIAEINPDQVDID